MARNKNWQHGVQRQCKVKIQKIENGIKKHDQSTVKCWMNECGCIDGRQWFNREVLHSLSASGRKHLGWRSDFEVVVLNFSMDAVFQNPSQFLKHQSPCLWLREVHRYPNDITSFASEFVEPVWVCDPRSPHNSTWDYITWASSGKPSHFKGLWCSEPSPVNCQCVLQDIWSCLLSPHWPSCA